MKKSKACWLWCNNTEGLEGLCCSRNVLYPKCSLFLSLIFILCLPLWSFAYHAFQIDSVIHQARKQMLSNPIAADSILSMALSKAKESENYHDAVPLLHQLAIVAVIRGDHASGQSLNKEAMIYAAMSGDTILLANCLTKMAKDHRNRGSPDSAVTLCMQAVEMYNTVFSEGNAWACYTILGDIARDQKKWIDAEQHYLKAWKVVQTLQKPKEEFIVAGFLRQYYLALGNEEKYAGFLETLLERNPYFTTDLNQQNDHYRNLLLIDLGNKESIEHLKRSVVVFYNLGHRTSLLAAMTRLGQLLTLETYYEAGKDTLQNAIALAGHSFPARMTLYYLLYENRLKANDIQASLYFYRQYHATRDSMLSEQAMANIRELEVRYNTREKETALAREQERVQYQITQRNLIILISAITLGFVLLGSWMIWHRAQLKQKLALQKETMQQQRIHQLEQEQKLVMMTSMIEGQEAERKRIAHDLHDGLGGLLSSVKVQLQLIQNQVAQLEAIDLYQRANHMIDHASTELRRIAYNMMPSSLSRLGLQAAVEDLALTLQADHPLEIDLQLMGLQERLDETSEIMIYRVIQELTNNVIKHARATRMLIQINKTDDDLFLIVEDNGVGMDTDTIVNSSGLGMESIESRVRFLNGTMDIGNGEKTGTCVTIQIPVQQKPAQD